MVKAPPDFRSNELAGHWMWLCFKCKYTACFVCFPPPYKNSYSACGRSKELQNDVNLQFDYPCCYLGQCVCRIEYRRNIRVFACSEKCNKFVSNYCKWPHRYHKQCFRLQVERMLNNWKGKSKKTRMTNSEHSYSHLSVPDSADEDE